MIYTGCHPRVGTTKGVLAHTYTLAIDDVRLNGTSVGEWGINAAVAGHFGVPVIMAAGNDLAVSQTREPLRERVVGVVVRHFPGGLPARHTVRFGVPTQARCGFACIALAE